MKQIITYLFLLLFFKTIAQPNLVLNPSFEDTIICPNQWGIFNPFVKNWVTPTTGSPDYYNKCASFTSGCSVPSNGYNRFQYPNTGNSYAGFFCFDGVNYNNEREYIRGTLLDTLKISTKYCVKFYINLSNHSKYSISNIGAYFSTTAINSNNYFNLPYTPQVVNPSNIQLDDTLNWLLIQGEFIAGGGEKYITIGNFNDDANTDTLLFNPNPFNTVKSAYYYIDDVSVKECVPDGVNEFEKKYFFNLYPNPNNGNMTLDYKLNENEKGEMVIYDVTGRILHRYQLVSNNTNITITPENFKNGIYMYSIFINNQIEYTDRIVIIK